jgi:hypothetical protein
MLILVSPLLYDSRDVLRCRHVFATIIPRMLRRLTFVVESRLDISFVNSMGGHVNRSRKQR